MTIRPIWAEDGRVFIIDQTLLPETCKTVEIRNAKAMWDAIKTLAVRGAPAIGIAAAFGVYLGVRDLPFTTKEEWLQAIHKTTDYLASSRPTAVNLFWALNQMKAFATGQIYEGHDEAVSALYQKAQSIRDEDAACCHNIGVYGAGLLKDCKGVLTHCNAGALATAEFGTALAPIYTLAEQGTYLSVYSDETRPLLQGSRLTAWELSEAGIPVTTICDNMAGVVMKNGWADAVIVGADRIALNGDTANKIGTYSLSVLAREHGIPFYVAAPFSTIDFQTADGSQIPIEERSADEVRCLGGSYTAPRQVRVFNPAFDVTPHNYITAFITDEGVIRPPFDQSFEKTFQEN